MALYVRQLNDGALSGVETVVAPHYDGQPDAELLDRKRTSHQAHGWTIEDTPGGFHAWKTYDHPLQPDRVDRYFELRG